MIIGGGLLLARRFSSPRTKALTALIQAHRFGDPTKRDQSIRNALAAFDIADQSTDDDIHAMLTEAKAFDIRYGRFHWGVSAEKLLLEECVARGFATRAD